MAWRILCLAETPGSLRGEGAWRLHFERASMLASGSFTPSHIFLPFSEIRGIAHLPGFIWNTTVNRTKKEACAPFGCAGLSGSRFQLESGLYSPNELKNGIVPPCLPFVYRRMRRFLCFTNRHPSKCCHRQCFFYRSFRLRPYRPRHYPCCRSPPKFRLR